MKTFSPSAFRILILLVIAFCKISASYAADPKFSLPLDCALNENCWVVKYVDVDPAEGAEKDFRCGPITSDEHKGVDFALRSRGDMFNGIDVYAAMDGQIMRVREGESDTVKTEEEFQAIKDARKECGNAVLIDHEKQGNGKLSTLYCHLKKGSIKVQPGDSIKAGQKIGEVGQSGYAEFAHLHFGVVQEGNVVDPYTGEASNLGCGRFKHNMWADDLNYDPITIFNGGFRSGMPDFNAIKAGQANPPVLPTNGEALVYWAGFFQTVEGDNIDMRILLEDGRELVSRHIVIEENRKRPNFYYTGRELNGKLLPAGIYTGETVYTRKGYPPKTVTHTIRIE